MSHPGFVVNSESASCRKSKEAWFGLFVFGPLDQQRVGTRIGDREPRVGSGRARFSISRVSRNGHELSWPRMLFDNCIGRKRDVGGGFLAGTCCWSGLWRELGFGLAMGTEEMLTVTFQNSSRLGYLIRMNVVRRSSGSRSERMCLELVKNTVLSRGRIEVTSQDRSQFNLRV